MLLRHLLEDFVGEVADLIAASPAFRDQAPTVFAVVNPRAGVFSRREKLDRALRTLANHARRRRGRRSRAGNIYVQMTEYSGHARAIAPEGVQLLEGARSPVMLSAGGDGTHRDLLSGLLSVASAYAHVSYGGAEYCAGETGGDLVSEDRVATRAAVRIPPVFRLPAGTGNDSADAGTMNEAFERLSRVSCSRLEAAIEARTADGRVFHAFNVASCGLDAIVSGVTNLFKHTHLPGNLYTLVADVATVLYVPIFGLPLVRVRWGRGSVRRSAEGRFALVAMGSDGYRRYGGGKPILPDERNLCMIRLPPLARRIQIKKHVYRGTHLQEREVSSDQVDWVEIHADERIPFQFDGEMVWLTPHSFPVTMRLYPKAWISLRA